MSGLLGILVSGVCSVVFGLLSLMTFLSRKKNIFKLAQGEYIAPEKIEAVYTQSAFVSQCFVYGMTSSKILAIRFVGYKVLCENEFLTARKPLYVLGLAGDSFNSNLVAVVVVDPETLPVWAKGRGIKAYSSPD